MVRADTKYMTSTHVHSLYTQNSPSFPLDCKTCNINTEKPKFYTLVQWHILHWRTSKETKKVQEAKFKDCNWCISIHFASVYFDEK